MSLQSMLLRHQGQGLLGCRLFGLLFASPHSYRHLLPVNHDTYPEGLIVIRPIGSQQIILETIIAIPLEAS